MTLEAIQHHLVQIDVALNAIADDLGVLSPVLANIVRPELVPQNGKLRGRSAVILLTSALGAHQPQDAIALALSAELIHKANKMHSMANNLSRQGNLLHAYILAADFLFTRATLHIASTRNLRAMDIASRTLARISEASFASTLQTVNDAWNWNAPLENYREKVSKEIAQLFATCGELGAVIANLDEEITTKFTDFGMKLGLLQHFCRGLESLHKLPQAINSTDIHQAISFPIACLLELHKNTANSATSQRLRQAIESSATDSDNWLLGIIKHHRGQIYSLAESVCQQYLVLAQDAIPKEVSQTPWHRPMLELIDLAASWRVY